MTMVPTVAWYVAYGSNISHDRFARYLETDRFDDRVASATNRWLSLDRTRYFAGTSATWGGAVAFLSLTETPGSRTTAYARRLSVTDLVRIGRSENGAENVDLSAAWSLNVDDWAQLDVPMSDSLGKYDAILRLPDIDGIPAYTFTTARLLPLGDPAPAYRELIEAISGRPLVHAAPDGPRDNRDYLPPSRRTSIDVPARGSAGFDLISLPALPGMDGIGIIVGRAEYGGAHLDTFLRSAGDEESDASLDEGLADALRTRQRDDERIRLSYASPLPFVRLPGRVGDIPGSDVVHTSPADAERLGKWALLSVPGTAGPVRVESRGAVTPGHVRIAYALRTIASISPDDATVTLQPLSSPVSKRIRARELARRLGEFLLGAPPLALRSTEGLVGDDGMPVVRVDDTALDLLGCSSGDTVIVSWAHRTARARVLLHTESTRVRMRAQLGEKTGHQSRASVGDVAARLSVPEHLQAWTSSTLRHELGIPPDTLVRIRRSVGHVVAKNAALLALPVTGVVFAAAAIPGVSQWALLAVPVVVLVSGFTIRMPRLRRR